MTNLIIFLDLCVTGFRLTFCPFHLCQVFINLLHNSYSPSALWIMIKKEELMSKQSDLDNHSNQMNPNNDAYWQSRGEDERPDDWVEQSEQDGVKSEQDGSQSGKK